MKHKYSFGKTGFFHFILAVIALAVLQTAVFAQVAATNAAVTGLNITVAPENSVPLWQTVVINVLYAAGAVVAGLLAMLAKKIKAKMHADEAQSEAIDAVTAAVSQTYVDLVRDLKAAGKFTPEMKVKARDQAIDLAKTIAKGPAKDLLVDWGKEKIGAVVEMVVTKLKGGTKLENGAVEPAK